MTDEQKQQMHNDLRQALEVLHRGGVILYPTDTVWGIGCDATNPEAVQRVYAIKQRTDSKALITLVDSPAKIQAHVAEMPDVAWDLIDVAVKPLTIIYDGARHLAPNLLAEDGSIAMRVTSEAFSQMLCMRFKKPIVSTSANISGAPTPATFAEIDERIKQAVDYVCTTRQDDRSTASPSSIIKLGVGGEVKIIRE